jgi:hypothetical protein
MSAPTLLDVPIVAAHAAAPHPQNDEAAANATHLRPGAMALDEVAAAPHAHADAAPSVADAAGASPVNAAVVSDDMHMHPDALFGNGSMPAAEDAGMPATMHAHPEPTAEERACFIALTAEAKAATARFADIEVARAEEYMISDDPTKTHMPNRAYMRDGAPLDLAKPETLVYIMRDGERVFAGAMYRALRGQGRTPCGAATYWHTHGRCVPPNGEAIAENKDKTCPAGYEHQDGVVEMMHLWFIPRRQR